MKRSKTHRNAIAILRAASGRSLGHRMWDGVVPVTGTRINSIGKGRAAITAPSRNAFGWFLFSWHTGDERRSVDLQRHRCIAKAEARRIIAG